jgi:hydrogenase/urease accessory protein HupE
MMRKHPGGELLKRVRAIPYTKLWLSLCTLLCLLSPQNNAHPLQVTTITVNIEEKTTQVVALVHLAQLAGANPTAAIPARLRLRLDGMLFRPTEPSLTFDPSGEMITWQAQTATPVSSVSIDAPMFSDYPGDATVVLVYRNGQIVDTTVVDRDSPSAIVAETNRAVFQRFVQMGIHHILSGLDHVLFVFGLLLVRGTLRGLLGMVTAFTLAHSITLSITALQIGSLPPRFVEPVIALSIIAVGVENLLHRTIDFERRVWFAFGFGFFHGFGFAGALAEAGLPRHAIGWSLASFNIGVEIGQACIVLVAVPLLRVLAKFNPELSNAVTRYASVGIATAGVIWFVQRTT